MLKNIFKSLVRFFKQKTILTNFIDNFYLENEAKLMKSLFSIDNYLGEFYLVYKVKHILLALLDDDLPKESKKLPAKRKSASGEDIMI